jgi:glycosyltransferase involved in cell wall biosynthesis
LRLGVYADLLYRADGRRVSTDRAFVRFITSLPPRVSEVVVFGRLDPRGGREPYELPEDGVRFVPFPYYESVFAVTDVLRGFRGSYAALARELDGLDALWLFGPHLYAVPFARLAWRRGKTVFLGVRQDYPKYIGGRLPNRRWAWALPAAHALETSFRLLARRAATVCVGEDLARKYAGGRAPVLATGLSLITAADVVTAEQALAKRWDSDIRLLTVGRLDPEKNPLLLPEIVARLRDRDRRWRLTIAGEGPMRPALERRIAELGVGDAVDVRGYVPNGPALWELYRGSHAFVHVSFTEGLPQTLFEALAAGLPIVATDVGGVRGGLDGGRAGLLVPPADAAAVAAALSRLTENEELRRTLVEHGLEHVRRETLDAQLDRIAAFFSAHMR